MISSTVMWFILTLIVAGVEMVTGTVHLLAVTLACAAAGTTAWMGGTAAWQFSVCAVVTVVGCVAAHFFRRRKTSESDHLLNMDDGQLIRVEAVGSDGHAVVQYRGAPWIAFAETGVLSPGLWVIARVDGTRLALRPVKQQ